MDIREAPSVRDWPPIRMEDGDKYGQFVLLRLDPIESVAHLEDEWATQEASQIPGDLCLAVVFGFGEYLRERPDHEFRSTLEFYPASPGLPPRVPTECLPLFPASDHPSGRPAVHPTPPLPSHWPPILYLRTTDYYDALVSRIHQPSGSSTPRLPRHVRETVWSFQDEDKRARMAPWLRIPPSPPSPPPISSIPSHAVVNGIFGPQVAKGFEDVINEGDDTDDYTSDSDSEPPAGPDPVRDALAEVERKARAFAPFVEIWLDLPAACPDPSVLAPPEKLDAAITQLRTLSEDWQKRAVAEILAKRPQTNAWLANVQSPEDEDAHLIPFETSGSLSDDEVLPEDAIEHRVEKSRSKYNDGRTRSGTSLSTAGSLVLSHHGSLPAEQEAEGQVNGGRSSADSSLKPIECALPGRPHPSSRMCEY